jgi:hypothetical protein
MFTDGSKVGREKSAAGTPAALYSGNAYFIGNGASCEVSL